MPRKVDNHASCRRLDLYKFPIHRNNKQLFIRSSLRFEQSEHKQNRKQANTLQCYSSEPVYSPQDRLLQRIFFNKKGAKHRNKRCFYPPNVSPLSKNKGGLVVQRRKANLRRATLTIMQNNFEKKLNAFDFNEQTQRTVKDQNIWRQFLQSPQTLQWAHLGRAS